MFFPSTRCPAGHTNSVTTALHCLKNGLVCSDFCQNCSAIFDLREKCIIPKSFIYLIDFVVCYVMEISQQTAEMKPNQATYNSNYPHKPFVFSFLNTLLHWGCTVNAHTFISLTLCRCLIKKAEVQGFIERCMVAVGTQPHHAHSLAEVLVEGDHRGHYSHGLNRMGEWSHPGSFFSLHV